MYGKDNEGFPFIKPPLFEKYCIKCWHCIAICPKGAISYLGIKKGDLEQLKSKDFLPYDQAEKFIRSRRSFRTFKKEPVPDDVISKWMDISRWSPTASNSQQLNWILVKQTEKVAHLARIIIDWLKEKNDCLEIIEQWNQGNDILLRHAPHLLIVTLPKDYFWAMTDAATAISYLELTAYSHGLGTCWAGYFTRAASEYAALRMELNLPENHKVAGALMFGYPIYRFSRIPGRKRISIQYL
jgi:nitroreductase